MLERAGCRVTTVVDGELAVRAVRSGEFGCVLMDVQLPEMDGLEATRRIRQEEQQAGVHIPIIAMTAHAMRGDREKCLAAGMDEYLPKPLEADRLYETLLLFHRAVEEPETPELPVADEDGADRRALEVRELIARVAGDTHLAEELLRMLRDSAPDTLRQARDALARGDLEQVGRLAHALKGAAANLAAKHVASAAAEVQRTAVDGQMEPTGAALDTLAKHIDQLAGIVDTKQWMAWVDEE
jgi:CheY-like chemotaxis protein